MRNNIISISALPQARLSALRNIILLTILTLLPVAGWGQTATLKELETLKIVYEKKGATPTSCTLSFPAGYKANYLRWVLLDGNTVVTITDQTFQSSAEGYTFADGAYTWYNNSASAGSDARKVTFKVPDSKKWADYKVVCYWAEEATGTGEPTWAGSFTWSFFATDTRDDFKSSPTVSADKATETIYAFNNGSTMSFNISNKMDAILTSLSKTSITEISELYVCLYYSKNAYDNNEVHFISDNDFYQCYNQKYWTWHTTEADKSLPEALDITLERIDGEGIGKNDTAICVLITDVLPETDSNTGIITTHPSNFKLKLGVKTLSDGNVPFTTAGNISSVDVTKTKNIMVSGSSVNLKIDEEELISDLNNSTGLNELYLRWYVVDKDGNTVSKSADMLTNSHYTSVADNGIYWYSGLSDAEVDNVLGVSFRPSSSFLDYKVVCVATDKPTDGMDTAFSYVVKEPNVLVKYEYTFSSAFASPFRHYGGYDYKEYGDQSGSDSPFNENGTQKVHEVTYYYYVDKGESRTLDLPFQNYSDTRRKGHKIEPRGYFRWYKWNTDSYSPRLARNSESGSLLEQLTNGSDSEEDWKGLVAFNLDGDDNAWQGNVGVKYNAPEEGYDNWQGDTIACDVSRYIDGGYGHRVDESGNKTNWDEPTLSVRYKFYIYPAEKVANAIRDSLINNNIQQSRTFEENEYTTFGLDGSGNVKKNTTRIHLRLTYNDIGQYWFYPLTENGKKVKIPFVENEKKDPDFKFENYHFSSNMVQATATKWYIYNSSRKYYTTIDGTSGGRFCEISLNKLNTLMWKEVDGNDSEYTAEEAFGGITLGSVFYVVTYLSDSNNNICPVADYMCLILNSKPMDPDEYKAVETRSVEYLESHYKQATDPMTFDNDNGRMDYSKPTKENNISLRPSPWANRFYGFVYGDKIPTATVPDYDDIQPNTPLHGEYGLYKSANVSGISDEANGYRWWTDTWKNTELFDRTWAMTNGAQYGYFLYTDASDESRRLCGKEFEGSLCPGSTFVFSAAVANLTHNSDNYYVELQFKLYGIDDNNNYKLLHSFGTGEFGDSEANGGVFGKWYQIFSKVTLQKSVHPERYRRFFLSVDNYCSHGAIGADFAIDDIRLYHRAAMVSVLQDKPLCEATTATVQAKLKLRMLYSSLTSLAEFGSMGGDETKTMHYRIVKKSDGSVVKMDYDKDGTEDEYGTFTVHSVWNNVPEKQRETIDGENYLILADQEFALDPNETYYVSISTDSAPTEASWGSPSQTCSVYSEDFKLVTQDVYITDANGNAITSISRECGKDLEKYSINVKVQTTDQTVGGSIDLSGVPFDWYMGTAEELNGTIGLYEALKAFRTEHSTGDLSQANGTENYYSVLKTAVDDNKLFLLASDSLTNNNSKYTFKDGVNNITVIPVITNDDDGSVTVGSQTYKICTDPIQFSLRVVEDGPKINLGFKDETYSSDIRTVRLGLPQLKQLQDSKGVLKLPVNSVELMNDADEGMLQFDVAGIKTDIVLTATNDPEYLDETTGNLKNTNETIATIDSETMAHDAGTLNIKFADNILNMLHEGYYYEVMFSYKQQSDNTATTQCAGETYFRINVVPEYVTWNPTADDGLNNNWNNDENWRRSSAAEIYKTSGYADYTTTTPASFVPMSFTKVTIPTPVKGTPSPSPLLTYLMTMTNGRVSNLSNNEYGATADIEYDIMVNDKLTDEKDYGCSKFYGNTCAQIYFKPSAELRQQQYLVYDKAWVEKELDLNKWYILGSPLYGTVAGDMYVPSATGRQQTEAFADIKFNNTDYSRKQFPFYQKAWDKSGKQQYSGGSWEAYHYPDGLTTMPEEINMESLLWSHVYNDVTTSYSPTYTAATQASGEGTLTGFAIKAGDEYYPKNLTNSAIVRLPKADDSYAYSGASAGTAITRTGDRYKMIIAAQTGATNTAPVKVKLTGNKTGDNLYYLTYNPYMSTLDMRQFFANADNAAALDGQSYWVITDQTVESGNTRTRAGETDVYVAPMQAFFVKAKAKDPVITFTTDMTTESRIIKGVTTEAARQTTLLTLKAQNSAGGSRSYMALKAGTSEGFDGSEDAELLYDNLFESVPTVYTVATDRAVALNALPEASWVPLGVVCGSAEDVSLSIEGLSAYAGDMYLYDAAEQEYTTLSEAEAVTIKSNAHGRYFLTSVKGSTPTRIDTASEGSLVRCYSPQAGLIVVSSTVSDPLRTVEVFDISGKQVTRSDAGGNISCRLSVPGGIYIVRATTMGSDRPATTKLSVR